MKTKPFIFLVITLFSFQAMAQSGKFGLGLILGDPSGITAKYWMDNERALSFGLGWHTYGRNYRDGQCYDYGFYRNNRSYCEGLYGYYDGGYQLLRLHADYLIHNFNVIKSPHRIPLYFGPGINLKLYGYDNMPYLGARCALGIAFMPRKTPIDVFFELIPIMDIFPRFWFDIDAGIGVRYYF